MLAIGTLLLAAPASAAMLTFPNDICANSAACTDGSDVNSMTEIFSKRLNSKVVTFSGFDLGAFPDSQRTSQFAILDGEPNLLFNSGPVTIGV